MVEDVGQRRQLLLVFEQLGQIICDALGVDGAVVLQHRRGRRGARHRDADDAVSDAVVHHH